MLPGSKLPASLQSLLSPLRSCFTTPTFVTFMAMVSGFVSQAGEVNVCGMLSGAGLSRHWHHSHAHRFFSSARWSPTELGLSIAVLIVERLVPSGRPLSVVVDDTLFVRSGRRVFGVGWAYDGSIKGPRKVSFGNCFVVVGIIVELPFCERQVCLPVLFALWAKGSSKVAMARTLVERLAEVFPGRKVDVVADAAYASKELKDLPPQITWTTRLRKDAALYDLAPPRTGRPGRPAQKGERVSSLDHLAKTLAWMARSVNRYGRNITVEVAHRRVLWPTPLGRRIARVVLVREIGHDGFDIALITTDIGTSPTAIVERYAMRWSIEVAFEEAKQVMGVGDARNRTKDAVGRTVPFGFLCQTVLWLWYSTELHDDDVVEERRARQPWYRTKKTPSTSDMLATARRHLIAARFHAGRPEDLTHQQIQDLLVEVNALAS